VIPRSAFAAHAACVVAILLSTQVNAIELISETEAAFPPDSSSERGITRGPLVRIVFPPPTGGQIKSPFSLQVKFESRGGSKVDLDSVVVTYRRIPAIALTQRIKRYINADGIEIPVAEVPPGTHRIRIEVRDSEGRAGLADFTFTATK